MWNPAHRQVFNSNECRETVGAQRNIESSENKPYSFSFTSYRIRNEQLNFFVRKKTLWSCLADLRYNML